MRVFSKTWHSPEIKMIFVTESYVHRWVFSGAQMTTAINQSLKMYCCGKSHKLLLITVRSSRPTYGVPSAVQVLLTLSLICSKFIVN